MARKMVPTSSPKLVAVQVTPVQENWSEYKLGDGTLLRVRPIIIEAEKLQGQVSPQGDPIYQIKAGVVLDVKSFKPAAKAVAKKTKKKVTTRKRK